jgi:Cys-tRNA(Pro)/Cys-tRNA(Cys) deacylase
VSRSRSCPAISSWISRRWRSSPATALAAKWSYPVFADETIELFDVISVSAGARGAQLTLSPADYIRATNSKVGPIAKEK